MAEKMSVRLKVNGKDYEGSCEPRKLLVDFVREDLRLTGTHVGCEHGVCGACTIIMDGRTVRSCLMFAVQADGSELLTVEGLAKDGELHPIQQAFWDQHGLQCGFCTPGMLMTIYEFVEKSPKPSEQEIREALAGNLCRCTGYVNIVKAVQQVTGTLPAETAHH
jgi:carbon-monoxide dehydrogenase small subunit